MIYCITGPKRSGKGEISKALTKANDERGGLTYEVAFADELRHHLEIMNPVVGFKGGMINGAYYPVDLVTWQRAVDEYGYEDAKDRYPEMRRLMQRYATEVIRDRVNERYWVICVVRKLAGCLRANIQKFNTGCLFLSLTDMRFENEYLGVRDFSRQQKMGLTLLKMERNAAVHDDAHRSEDFAWVEKYPHTLVDNNGTVAELWDTARKLAWGEVTL